MDICDSTIFTVWSCSDEEDLNLIAAVPLLYRPATAMEICIRKSFNCNDI